MNIVVYDPYAKKFTQDMITWWEKHGHQVKYSNYYNPELVAWADVLWFDTTDNNIASATNPGQALLADDANFRPWDLHDHDMTGKRIVVRAIDIEIWHGHQMAAHWDLVDDLIFIAPHIRNLVDVDALPLINPEKLKVHIIPCGVDLDRWTFKERKPGFNIAVISEKWTSKGTDLILQIALKLKQIDSRYKIHWLGKRSDYPWEYAYFDDFVEHHKLPIEFTNVLQDDVTVDQFLEDKDYLLHASHKEGFSYATAEAMAKGIRPVVHRFFGADDIWSGITWDHIDEAVDMITDGEYDSASYRQYLIDHGYTLPQMMAKIDKIINKEKV